MNPIRPNLSSVILSLSLAVILGLLVVLNPLPAQAQTWSGGGANDNWTNGANWGGTAPISGNGLSFAGTTRLTPVNDFAEDTSFGAITFDSGAGAFTLSGNRITLTGNVTNSSSTLQTINLDMILGSTRTFSGDLAVGGILSGAGGLTAATPGTLTLTGANTYSGATTVSTGVLNIQNASALGTTAAGTTVNSGAALQIQGGITTAAEALTLNGTGVSSDGALRNISGTNTYAGLVTLGAAARINSDAGTLTLSNTGTITGAGRGLTVGGAGNTTIASAIGTGSGTLTKDGAGTLTLTRQNTFSGATTISAGTLAYGVSNALGTGSVTVSDTGILDLGADQSDSVGTVTLQGGGQIIGTGTSALTTTGSFAMQSGSVSAILAGAVPLNKTSSGTVTLSGANTYTGLTTVSDGTLRYGASDVISTGAVTVNGATAILDLGANQSDSVGTVTLQGGGQIIGTGTSTLTTTGTFEMQSGSVSAILAGNGDLNKTTAGTLTLSGANTHTGTTRVSDGTLRYGASNVIGTGNVTLNGATAILDLGAFSDTVGTVTLQGGGQIIGTGTSTLTSTVTFAMQSGSVSARLGGSLGLNKTSAGTLTLSGANTYTGTTAITGGTLLYGASDVIATGNVNVNGATAILDLGAFSDTVGRVFLQSGGRIIGSNGSTLTSTAGFVMHSGSVSAILAGSVDLDKTTADTVTLSAANTYTGTTSITAGTLLYGASDVIGTGNVTVNGATAILDLGANQSDTVGTVRLLADGRIIGTGTSTLTSTGTFEMQAGTVSAILAGVVPLNKTTSGTVTLSGANTYTGLTTVSAGTLAYGASNVISTGAVTVSNSGILDLGANQSDSVGTVTLTGGGQINGSGTSTLTSTGSFEMQFGSVSAILAGAVPLNKTSSGTVTLSGANTYTGETTITLGTLQLGNGGTTGKLSTSSAIVNNGTLRINRSDAVAQGTDFTGAAITGTGALVHLGAGTTTLSAANTFTGTTTVSGGKVALTNPLALQNSAYVTTGSNGTTIGMDVSDPGALDSGKLTLGGLAGAVDLAGAFTAGFTGSVTNLTLNPQTGNSNTYSGVIANGAMTLTKTGAGIQTLSGANTYTGTTTINGGVLAVTNGAAIADTGAVVLADVSGATLTVENSETIGSLRGGGANGGNVTIASGQTLTVAETGSQTFAGIISDAGGLTKTAAGTLTLTGANTYTGGTTINGGTLALGSAGAIGSSGTIAFGGGTLQYSASNTTDYSDRFSNGASQQYSIDTNSQNVTLATALTSSGGSFTKLGAGTLALTGANTYDGATTVSAGALQVGSSGLGQTGTGAVTVQTGSTLLGTGLVQGSTFTLDNGGTLRPGDSVADSSHGTLTFDPVSLSGDISLQGNIIMGISGATYFDATYGGNSLGSAGYNTWVDGISGVGTHDRLVFNQNFLLGYNVSFLNTTGGLEVVGNSFTPERGQVFNLMDWGGLINMNFTGFNFNNYVIGNGDEGIDLDLPDLSAFDLAWDMSRFTTSGNIVVIPEPSRALLMMVGLAGLALRRRRQGNRAHSHFALRGSTQ